jgi:putative restriction endonuclease
LSFRCLQLQHDEVNFWQPSGTNQFRALQAGELFLFKLHAPENFIVGGGVFSHASNFPLSIAWEAFGLRNGVTTLAEMRERIAYYRCGSVLADNRPGANHWLPKSYPALLLA